MVALFIVAAALHPGWPAGVTPALHLEPCTVAGAKARCGTFDLAESPSTQRPIALKVIVLAATEHNDSAIFPFNGGPGEPTTPGVEDEIKYFGAELRRHDAVFVDQRGTGGSAPLDCPNAKKAHQHELIEGEMFPLDFVADCRREIEPHAYLAAYTTPQFADDVDALRLALGYGRIDVVGLSYGTRSALTFLERHPKSVRTLLLEGPLPPDNIMPLNVSRDAQAVLERIVADCRAEAACNGAFPDIGGDLARTLAALDATPAQFTAGNYHVTMSRGMFGEFLRSQMYAADAQRLIPLMLHRAASGDWSWIGPFWLRYRSSWYDHIGLLLSVSCSGDVRWINPASIAPANDGTFIGDYRVRRQIAACEAWAPARVPRVTLPRVDVPVLIVTGDRDPVTPAHWAESLQRQLKRAKAVILANSGHIDTTPCSVNLEVGFFDAGSFDHLDTSCAAAIPRKPYLTEFPAH